MQAPESRTDDLVWYVECSTTCLDLGLKCLVVLGHLRYTSGKYSWPGVHCWFLLIRLRLKQRTSERTICSLRSTPIIRLKVVVVRVLPDFPHRKSGIVAQWEKFKQRRAAAQRLQEGGGARVDAVGALTILLQRWRWSQRRNCELTMTNAPFVGCVCHG